MSDNNNKTGSIQQTREEISRIYALQRKNKSNLYKVEERISEIGKELSELKKKSFVVRLTESKIIKTKEKELGDWKKKRIDLLAEKSSLENKFEEQIEAYITHKDFNKELGLVLNKGIRAIDVDDVKDPATGKPDCAIKGTVSLSEALKERKEIIEKLKSKHISEMEAVGLSVRLEEVNSFIRAIITASLQE